MKTNVPILLVLVGAVLRPKVTIFLASSRISMMLLIRASRGANGNAATKMVVKLNWITVGSTQYELDHCRINTI